MASIAASTSEELIPRLLLMSAAEEPEVTIMLEDLLGLRGRSTDVKLLVWNARHGKRTSVPSTITWDRIAGDLANRRSVALEIPLDALRSLMLTYRTAGARRLGFAAELLARACALMDRDFLACFFAIRGSPSRGYTASVFYPIIAQPLWVEHVGVEDA